MTIAIGKTSSGKVLELPIDLGTQTVSVLGIRGSGKTHTAKRFAEGLLDVGHQVIIIDPLDVWWGLRSSRTGDRSGYPIVVLGGDHQDLPLEAAAGRGVAEFAVHQQANLILSTRHMSKNDQRRFVTDFAERLYEMKGRGEYRTPLHLLIDEADLFAPQRLHAGMERLYGSIDQLVRRGRASGIGVTLITQRAAVLNKDVLTQSELLVCHRTVGPQDRKAIESWVEVHDVEGRASQVLASIAQLERGEAWFWSPGWLQVLERVKVSPAKTFDSSYTPKAAESAGPVRSVLLPPRFVRMIPRLLAGEETMEIWIASRHILLRGGTGRVLLASGLVDGAWPEWRPMLAAKGSMRPTVTREDFVRSLRRAGVLTSSTCKGVKMEFGGGRLDLSSRTMDCKKKDGEDLFDAGGGAARIHVPATYDGPPTAISVDPRLLLDGLGGLDTDAVSLEMDGPTRPATVRTDDYVFMVMPMHE